MGRPAHDLTGKVFGELTVLSRAGSTAGKKPTWNCMCSCGTAKVVAGFNLKSGSTASCGHLRYGSNNRSWNGFEGLSGWYWGSVCRNAKQRGFEVGITIEDAWFLFLDQGGRCALTGQPLQPPVRYAGANGSLDRIDSTRGYVVGNVQWVHKDVNRIKMDLDQETFIALCRLVAEHNPERETDVREQPPAGEDPTAAVEG